MSTAMDIFKERLLYLEEKIGYRYKNKNHLVNALTHSSYANEFKHFGMTSNERLEFLGDAVLNVVISEEIFTRYAHLSEGEMTKVRAGIVCESSLMRCSNNLEIGKYLLLGKGEELTGGRQRVSILSDAFEAIIGSIYIDGGINEARNFIFSNMKVLIQESLDGVLHTDYKTQLQEKIQKHGDHRIVYEIVEEKGPDHNKVFVIQVNIANKVMGMGEGKSKKEAEQNAARVALEKLGR